jgi:GTPase SAR1 family protein
MVENVFGGGDMRNSKKGTISAKQFKVIMIGESMVGKTSLIQRFVEGQFHTGNAPTLAWDFKVKTL